MSKLIETWDELVGLENDEYYLDIKKIGDVYCSGWIIRKSDKEHIHYLSTHTFYGLDYEFNTVELQECGFDIQLKNWDGETVQVNYTEQWKYNGKCELCRKNNYCGVKCKAAIHHIEHLKELERIKKEC